jgi:hypothetical protein
MLQRDPDLDVRYFTDEEKRFMLADHRTAPAERGGINYDLLVRLGDEEMTAKYVKRWNEGSSSDAEALAMTGNAELIPRIVPPLFADEKFEWVANFDVLHRPHSFDTPWLMLRILRGSPKFPPEVIQWADRLLQGEGDREFVQLREIMREWWQANEPVFKQRNYQAVKPGREVVKEPKETEQQSSPPEALGGESAIPPHRRPPLSGVVSRVESSSQSNAVLWAAAAAALALFAALLLVWKWRV